jgi:hypothetical protein
MRENRRRPTSSEEQTYALRLHLVTPRLDALIYHHYGCSTAVSALLDDAINLRDDAERWKRDNIDAALQLLDRAIMVVTAAEDQAMAERETRETRALRKYTAMFAIVSALSERIGQHVRTRSGGAYIEQAQALIAQAIHTRHGGNIDRAVQSLHRAVTSLRQGEVLEETFGPRLDQLREWYDIVARGVEPGSEAHTCLQRFVVAVDVFNNSTARDDTDHMIETFNMAVEVLKEAAAARPRR